MPNFLLSFLLLSIISGLNASYSYSSSSSSSYSCSWYANKIYQLKVTFPGKVPLYAAVRFLTHGAFDELFSIANGNNAAEVGADFALSNRCGYYRCPSSRRVTLTGFGFLYKSDSLPFLAENGATVMHDYDFNFSSDGKSLTGKVRFAVFRAGTNPFTRGAQPVFEGPLGDVTGELITFRPLYDLSGY